MVNRFIKDFIEFFLMTYKSFFYATLISFLAFSCAPSRFVKPLDKGKSAIGANLGGALFDFGGATIPMPLTSITYGYGLKENTTLYGSLHTTSLLFGVGHIDLGAVHQLKAQKGWIPAITFSPAGHLALDRWDGKFEFWPQMDVNMYWHYLQKSNFVYLGLMNWFDFTNQNPHRSKSFAYIWAPMIGHTFVRSKMNYNLEFKYIAPNKRNDQSVVAYQGINGRGALGIYLAIIRKF